jgi:hypothetical protein
MLCRVVARSNADLQRVIDAIVSAEGVTRSATLISLATQVPYRVLPLVRAAATSTRGRDWEAGTVKGEVGQVGSAPAGDRGTAAPGEQSRPAALHRPRPAND